MGNPPHSPLLEHVPAMAVLLDCSGHIFPFISPGTEMDVGQALQPGETPLCAAQNTCPAVRWHPQSLPGQGGASSLYNIFPKPLSPGSPKEQDEAKTYVHRDICHPKQHS